MMSLYRGVISQIIPHRMGGGFGVKYQINLFVKNCIKYPDMHRKQWFLGEIDPQLLHKKTQDFMQFLAKNIFWYLTPPLGVEAGKMTFYVYLDMPFNS